ncbi:BgTH12-03278 [Blumeria graminis f. sp. triticale]|uniref:BgtA-20927 n=3 Tax=Blumeria graminis TaxID=34373 RepID=A0A9X9QE89_BLUGR|nr:hypothetical protein BGT96224_A20927 [Blumeria graminis f. sp. tritici 96224]CAD6503618.1 BgTH12-03278 [Blumeria graminis f. sp. triticale]VDB89773.1 BgtA-20927 [Blumeria graminis f. sp. tritici]
MYIKIAPGRSPKELFVAYLAALNSHVRFSPLDLSPYMNSTLNFNNRPITISQYEGALLHAMDASPDFNIDVQIIVAEGTNIATRFLLTCTPDSEFKGTLPTGEQVQYIEHVFYRFNGIDGKCSELFTLEEKLSK